MVPALRTLLAPCLWHSCVRCLPDLIGALRRLLWQLGEDCRLLEQLKVMDYSLLLGVSFCNPGYGSSPVTDRVPPPCHALPLLPRLHDAMGSWDARRHVHACCTAVVLPRFKHPQAKHVLYDSGCPSVHPS